MASSNLVLLDPASIKTDAETYQFRSRGDARGVTANGRYNAERWDPILYGDPLLVHERLDGSLYVADGHHRLDLAKRLNAEGKGPGAIAAYVLREADGYTPRDMRVIAAYKNMAHGHSGVVDAARVFKEAMSGKIHTNLLPQLQMDKGNLRLSYRLSGLSDKALGEVDAGVVPANIAATVADHVREPEQQESVMRLFANPIRQSYVIPPGYNATLHFSPAPTQPSFAAKLLASRAQLPGFERHAHGEPTFFGHER